MVFCLSVPHGRAVTRHQLHVFQFIICIHKSCLAFTKSVSYNHFAFLFLLKRARTAYRIVQRTRRVTVTIMSCCSGWQKAYSWSTSCGKGTIKVNIGHNNVKTSLMEGVTFNICHFHKRKENLPTADQDTRCDMWHYTQLPVFAP